MVRVPALKRKPDGFKELRKVLFGWNHSVAGMVEWNEAGKVRTGFVVQVVPVSYKSKLQKSGCDIVMLNYKQMNREKNPSTVLKKAGNYI